MESKEASPEEGQKSEKSVSRNPFTNLRTLMKGKLPHINLRVPGDNFWKSLTVGSVILNILLLLAVFAIANGFFEMRAVVHKLVNDSVAKAVRYDEGATLSASVQVQQEVPLTFDVPLQRSTNVSLSEQALLEGSSISIRSATLSIDAPATITLPAGAELPLALDTTVRVETVVPIDVTVPVEFPIAGSEIEDSLNAMKGIFEPFQTVVSELPGCWQMLLWGGECE